MTLMVYSDTIDYLYGLQKHGIKLGLDNIRRLLSAFGNPQNNFRSVHVAGTNGKGSTSAMIASILRSSGFKTGLFTSPHLVSFTERIRVDNEEIAEQDVVLITDEIREAVSQIKDFSPTFFEVVTTMGFLYFKRKGIDIAVVETGMGGRLDATNVLIPEVSVITNISYDHKEFLGNTLPAIAEEKAGIIKDMAPVVVSPQDPEALAVIEKKAIAGRSRIFIYGRDFSSAIKSEDANGSVFDYFGDENLKDLRISLSGRHQVLNAALTIKAIEVISKNSHDFELFITQDAIRSGLENIKWRGRLELISDSPPILIDGAHNPAAASVLAESLKNNFLKAYRRIIFIFGIMADKDIRGIMEPLLPLASEVILTKPSYARAASPEVLAGHIKYMEVSYKTVYSLGDAISIALKLRNEGDLIVITGSFYTIGEAAEIFGGKGVLSGLRE